MSSACGPCSVTGGPAMRKPIRRPSSSLKAARGSGGCGPTTRARTRSRGRRGACARSGTTTTATTPPVPAWRCLPSTRRTRTPVRHRAARPLAVDAAPPVPCALGQPAAARVASSRSASPAPRPLARGPARRSGHAADGRSRSRRTICSSGSAAACRPALRAPRSSGRRRGGARARCPVASDRRDRTRRPMVGVPLRVDDRRRGPQPRHRLERRRVDEVDEHRRLGRRLPRVDAAVVHVDLLPEAARPRRCGAAPSTP